MYNAVIVDDEPWALIGIRKLLEAQNHRFQIVAETTDPVKAFQIICEDNIDVVFTDIRMPEISGLDLLRKSREKGIDTDFIVISGFAEFSYAQQALQEGALDYQLKPLEMDKAQFMLDKLYNHLENKHSKKDLDLYVTLVEDDKQIKEVFKTKGIRCQHKYYQAVTVCFKSEESIPELFDTFNTCEGIDLIKFRLSSKKIVYIFNSVKDITMQISIMLNERKNALKSAGISWSSESIEDILILLKASDMASNDYFVDSNRCISIYKRSSMNVVMPIVNNIISSMSNNKYTHLVEITSNLAVFFETNQLGIEDALFLWNQIAAYLTRSFNEADQIVDIEFLDYSQLIGKFSNLNFLGEYLNDQLQLLNINKNSEINNPELNENFKQMLLYIDQNYYEDLLLKDLASKYFINLSYCCELFKKVTGKTYSQYITDLRIRKACHLLRSTGLSLAEICEKVGYNDYFYFNKVFKKCMNCTPSKYRKSS